MVDGAWLKGEAVGTASRKPAVRQAQESDFHPVIRVLDVIIAALGLAFVAPLMLLVATLVSVQDGGPAVFVQRRIGLGGQMFDCFKFRSMVLNAEEVLEKLLAEDPDARAEWEADQKLRNDPRITSLGHFLRKSSLDELPQLFNVLKGEMTLVGPRPIVTSEIVKYGRAFRHYCAVRPGITGLWQVSGRNEVTYNRRVALDVAFVQRKSVGLYLKILFATVPSVLLRKGAF